MNLLSRGKAIVGALVSKTSIKGATLEITGAATADSLAVAGALTSASVAATGNVGGATVSSSGLSSLNSAKIGAAGTIVKAIKQGSGAIDLASITNAEAGSGTLTITGAAVGDIVFVQNPVLTVGLIVTGVVVTGADTATVYFLNVSAAPIDQASATFGYLWIDLT